MFGGVVNGSENSLSILSATSLSKSGSPRLGPHNAVCEAVKTMPRRGASSTAPCSSILRGYSLRIAPATRRSTDVVGAATAFRFHGLRRPRSMIWGTDCCCEQFARQGLVRCTPLTQCSTTDSSRSASRLSVVPA